MTKTTKYPNSGALFPNDKRGSENSPHYKGNLTLDVESLRVELEEAEKDDRDYIKLNLSGWRKVARTGVKFMALKNSYPGAFIREQRGNTPPPQPQQEQQRDIGDSSGDADMPF